MLLGAVAVVVLLMVVGWRRPWDPTPQELPSVTLKSASAISRGSPLPRWYWPLTAASLAILPLAALVGGVTGQRWVLIAGVSTYGATWAVRVAMVAWTGAATTFQRSAAVARPIVLLAGCAIAAVTRSIWWLLGGAILFLATGIIVDVFTRQPANRSEDAGRPSLQGRSDTRR